MDEGKLRHRVIIEQPITTQDSNGDPIVDYETFKTVWAAIEPLSGKDFIAAQAEQSEITARIVIRHLPCLTANMRINHNSTIYNIEGILPDKDSGLEYMTIPVSQGVKNA